MIFAPIRSASIFPELLVRILARARYANILTYAHHLRTLRLELCIAQFRRRDTRHPN